MTDQMTLTVNGQIYQGWTSASVTRSLETGASVFDLSVTERWASNGAWETWQIVPGNEAVVAISGTPILTGYVERYCPSIAAGEHTVSISGRSKTCDLIDSMPDIKGGQYRGYTADKIAAAVAAEFGVSVVVGDGVDTGDPFPQTMYERCETAYVFIEKMCRMRGLLVCDDAAGNLVLTQAGPKRASGALIQGQNIHTARANLTADKRFQQYVVYAQAPLSWNETAAQPKVSGSATDAGVTRFRRFAEIAEIPADEGGAKARAVWRARYNFGQSVEAQIGVKGWRQIEGGDLWDVNMLVPVTSSALSLDQDLLIGSITWRMDVRGVGAETEMTLKPAAAYTPEPVKWKKKRGTAPNWNDAVGIG